MIIEKFFRNITEDPHWVLVVKAKWGTETKKYLISFESFAHPDMTAEAFVCVRVWEQDNPAKAVEKHSFLKELDKLKTKLKVKSVIELYQKYKGGTCCDI